MRLKDFRFLWIVFLLIQNTFSQSKSVTFKVVDKNTNKALSLVNIVKSKEKFVDFTDNDGLVTFKITEKKNSLSFSLLGYQTLEREFLIGSKNTFLIKLSPFTENLNEVIINAQKKENYALTTLKPVEGTHIYAGKKTEVINLDLVQGNKAANNSRQVFAKVAGLNIYESNDGGLQLNIGGRGLDPNRTANFNTRQNDYDISADVLGYPESYYTPPTEALKKIQVIRGAASLQYGTQFGGLINFITKSPVKNKPIEIITRNTAGSFKALSNFTSLSGTTKRFSYYAYYNGKKGDGFRPNSDYSSTNFFAHLGYKLNKRTNASFEISSLNYTAHQPGGLSDVQFLENPFQSYLNRNWFEVDWKLYNLKFNHHFTNVSKLSISIFALNASRKAIGFRGKAGENEPKLFLEDGDEINEFGAFKFKRDLLVGTFKNYGTEVRFLSNYLIKDRKQHYLLGVKIYKANNSSQQGAGSLGTDANFNFVKATEYPNQNKFDYPNFNTSFFGEHIFNINTKLSITPGFRFEHIQTESKGDYLNYNVNQPQLSVFNNDNKKFIRNFLLLGIGLSYKPYNTLEVYTNVSQNYRSVTFSDIRTVSPSFLISENITDEKGYTADVGVRGRFKKTFSYDANLFTLLYDNRIGQALNNRAQWVRGNIGKAVIYGLESLFQWNLKEQFFRRNKNLKLSLFTNLALTKSVYLNSKDNNVKGNEVEFIPYTNLKTGVEFGFKNLLTNLQYTYVGSQFTDVTNSPYDPFNTTEVEGAIPSYDILDLSVSYKFNKYFKLEAGINNLLNNSYFTRRATGYPGPGIIPSEPRAYYATLEIKI